MKRKWEVGKRGQTQIIKIGPAGRGESPALDRRREGGRVGGMKKLLWVCLVGTLLAGCGDWSLDGNKVFYHENGQKKSEGLFKNGRHHGLWTYWYANGQKERETTYKDGKMDGPSTWWNEKGQKKREGHFLDGKMEGSWVCWFESEDVGEPRSKQLWIYKGGEVVSIDGRQQ